MLIEETVKEKEIYVQEINYREFGCRFIQIMKGC